MHRGSCLASHPLRRVFDGTDDIMIAGAATKIAFEFMPYACAIGRLSAADHVNSGHDHAGCAEPALKPVIVAKGLLDRMQFAVLGKTFDRRDIGALCLDREYCA